MKTFLSLVLVLVMAGAVCAQPPKDRVGQKPQVKQEKPERPMMGPPPWARHGMMGVPERPFQSKGCGPAVYHRGSGPKWGDYRGHKQGYKGQTQGRKHKGYRKHSKGLTIIIRIG